MGGQINSKNYHLQRLLTNFVAQQLNMKFNLITFFFGLLLLSCNPSAQVDNKAADKDSKKGFSKSDIIRMPISANEPLDTSLVAKMDFEETVHEFGTVLEGKQVEHVFKFKNTGKVPLLISEAKATCGCTASSYPKEPIAPGESSEIAVRFNTAGKKQEQSKPLTLIANTFPSKTILTMKGYVQPNPQLQQLIDKQN